MSAFSAQHVLSVQRAVTRVENKQHEASVIVFILPLEAAIVMHDASRPFSALVYCVMNDSARFSAAPATDATRKNYRYGFLPITIVPPINYRCRLIGKTDESVDLYAKWDYRWKLAFGLQSGTFTCTAVHVH